MLEYKNIKYNITDEPNPNGKGRLFQYSINFGKLKKLNASGFQDAISCELLSFFSIFGIHNNKHRSNPIVQ